MEMVAEIVFIFDFGSSWEGSIRGGKHFAFISVASRSWNCIDVDLLLHLHLFLDSIRIRLGSLSFPFLTYSDIESEVQMHVSYIANQSVYIINNRVQQPFFCPGHRKEQQKQLNAIVVIREDDTLALKNDFDRATDAAARRPHRHQAAVLGDRLVLVRGLQSFQCRKITR